MIFMKILHTADWHLGNSFHGHDRMEEHRHFLQWLADTLRDRQPDVLVIAGDVFDSSNPSAASEEMLYGFLLRATHEVPGLQVVITAGNHDSAGRIEAPAALLKLHNIYVRGTVHRLEDGTPDFDFYLLPLSLRNGDEAEAVCIALPYLRSCDYPAGMSAEEGLRYYYENCLRRLRKSAFRGLPVWSAAHFYAAGSDVCGNEHSERLVVGGQDCVRADVAGKDLCYMALGHIHKAQRVGGGASQVYYAGSALPMSFSERHYSHGAAWVEISPDGKASVSRLTYEPLRRLLAIPSNGAATPEAIMAEISELPKRKKDDDGTDWPYLEIRVLEQRPEPSFVNEVNTALENRAVRLCRIVRELPVSGLGSEERSVEQLRHITPMEMAEYVYKKRYNAPLPPEQVERFRKAEAQAYDHDGEE